MDKLIPDKTPDANIFATILSLIAGHITIYFHRCTLASDETREFHFNTRWDDANIIHGNCGANAARGRGLRRAIRH